MGGTCNIGVLGKQMKKKATEKKKGFKLADLLIAFLLPTLGGKVLILYFGSNYSRWPGEGYGYGLAISILFTLSMVGRFLWRYRDYQD